MKMQIQMGPKKHYLNLGMVFKHLDMLKVNLKGKWYKKV